MRYLGVIGYPLKRSLSPVFQQAALDHLGLDVRYEAWPTPPDRLLQRVESLRRAEVLGANVTIPHKQAVLPMMDDVDELVRRVGAVNTIVNRSGRLHAFNTDVAGFLRGLIETATFDPAGKRALVAGAGGAARAVVVALIQAGAASVVVINRTYSRASELVHDVRPFAGETALSALPDIYASWASVACDLLVNCTSVGMAGTPEENESPAPAEIIRSGMLVYDLIYNPRETPLLREARARGARVLDGLPMLVYQGAAAFELWTGRRAPVDVMFRAAEAAVGGG